MSLKVADLYGELDLHTGPFDRQMGGIKGKLRAIGPLLATAAVAGGAALGVGIYKAVTAASDLEETVTKTKVVFGDQAAAIIDWSKSSATSMGQSKQAALEAAATFGNLFVSMGMGEGVSAKMSMKLTQLAGDLASFNNIDPTEALDALRSGLVGETEPLRRLGVNMNEATLKAQALKMGLIKSADEGLTPAAKAQAAYALILGQTKTAQGDFARTSDGFANQMRILKSEISNLFADVGKYLLPIATDVVKGIRTIASGVGPVVDKIRGFFSGGAGGEGMASKLTAPFKGIGRELSPIFADIGAKLGELWEIVGPALKTVAGFLVDTLGEAFTYLRPLIVEFGKTVAKQIGYVVKLAQFIKQHWGSIVKVVGPIFNIIKTIISTVFKVIVDIVRVAMSLIRGDWSGAWNGIKRIGSTIMNGIVTIVKNFGRLVVAGLKASWSLLKSVASSAWNGVKSAVQAGASAVVSYVKSLPGRILSALGNLGQLLYSAGSAVITGFINGITANLGRLWSIVSDIASTIKNKITGALGIDSPSKVFRGYGINLMEGLALGIGEGRGLVDRTMTDMARSISVNATAQMATAGAGASQLQPYIDLRGALFAEDAASVIYGLAKRGAKPATRQAARTRGVSPS